MSENIETAEFDTGRTVGTEQTNPEDIIFEIKDTSVSFDMDRGESRVLDNASLEIKRQEILGVVGESGSGKSMFASALLDAIVKPGMLTGSITYYPGSGEAIDLLSLSDAELRQLRWEEISMVFQGAQSSFNPTISIRKHFTETLKAHDYDINEGIEHARELLSELYLDPDRILNSYPHELSGGMKQRALIALSLVLKPQVLVMDEPTAALDLLMQRSILSLLESLQQKYNLTVVFITHDLPLVAGLADRLAVMYAFEFIEVGEASEIIRNPSHPYTRALLSTVPNLSTSLEEMKPIKGSSPDPVDVPNGCSYHPRCPLANDQCTIEDPVLMEVTNNNAAACFHVDRVEEAIPLEIDSVTQHRSETETTMDYGLPLVSLEGIDMHFEQSSGMLSFFDDLDIVHAVDKVDLNIYENDVVALVGESGCGKTTLGKISIGVQDPTNGSVQYRGTDIKRAKSGNKDGIPFEDIRRSLQIIHQDPGSSLNPNRKVMSILDDPLRRWQSDLTYEDRQSRILGMLEHVGMSPPEDYAQRYPHQLSGGEKQRVALIRAMLMNPDMILADEAVSALDVSLRVEMMDLMLSLQEMVDTSYLFISHDLANARYLASHANGRIGVMYLGEIIEIGPAEEVIQNPKHPYTQILKWATADLDVDEDQEKPPIRGIDIPDPIDPPSGCRFHTRCPEAREVCTRKSPSLTSTDEGHAASCFIESDSDHAYWSSEPLTEVDDEN